MDLSIFPDSMKPSKVVTEGLTLETIASRLTYFSRTNTFTSLAN